VPKNRELKSATESRCRMKCGATQNEKLNSPPDHHRSLPTLI
jgi:hypothetical protein